jgi:hypothetical protein
VNVATSILTDDSVIVVGNSSFYSGALGHGSVPGWGRAARCDLLRDIFGNPFRAVSLNLALRTPTVTKLARAAYHARSLPSGELDLARLAVLADALEEAGCSDTAILCHLRSADPHVRGRWPVDLLLFRE